jgi:hypothetical protein
MWWAIKRLRFMLEQIIGKSKDVQPMELDLELNLNKKILKLGQARLRW